MSMSAKDRLSGYIPLMIEILDQQERLARMRSAETNPPRNDSTGGTRANSTCDRMERAILTRLSYENKIAPRVEAAFAELETIRAAIDGLDDPMFRTVLRLRYVDAVDGERRKWNDVAIRIYGKDEERHVRAAQRLHDKAILAISPILELE